AQHAGEIVSALEDEPACPNHAIGALAAGKPRILLDAIEGNLAGVPEHGKYRLFAPEIDGVIAPFAGRDLAAADPENFVELLAGEQDDRRQNRMHEIAMGGCARMGRRAQPYWLDFAQRRLPGCEGL